jgi:hypothetical protein
VASGQEAVRCFRAWQRRRIVIIARRTLRKLRESGAGGGSRARRSNCCVEGRRNARMQIEQEGLR